MLRLWFALIRKAFSHEGARARGDRAVDRAWGYLIQAPKMAGAQITSFRSSLSSIMTGHPVGHAVKDQFAALSTALLSASRPAPRKWMIAILLDRALRRAELRHIRRPGFSAPRRQAPGLTGDRRFHVNLCN
jgi:hypothetical protein